jgi:O-succinylbenzoate synthase
MKITKITLHHIEIPTKYPFTTGFGTITSRPTIIVKAETKDGLIGWGESSPLPFPMYKPETIDTCMISLEKYIAPLVMNKEFNTIEEFVSLYSPIKGNLFAKTGIETAVWMLLALEQNTSIVKLLGGTRKRVETGISVGIGTLEETFEKIQKGIDAGTKRVKLKIKPGWDVELVKKVRKKFGNITLMVDGNSSYTLDNIESLKKLDKYNLLMIEQPLGDEDIIDHSILQKEIKTPICLDESIANAEDARKAHYLGACKIINIKPGRVGGLLESKKIHDYCQENGIGVWCGGMLESGIARAVNLATASMSNYIYPADLDEPLSFFEDDIVINGYKEKNGLVAVPTDVGLGFTVDEKKVKYYAVRTVKIIK